MSKASRIASLQWATIFCSVLAFSVLSRAESVINPDNNFQQYTSYGMFFDPQSMLVSRSGGNAWGAVGGTVGLVGYPDMKYPSMLIMHGSANASYRLVEDDANWTIETKFETIDARVGLSWDMKFTDDWRGAIIWTHESGHISDNIADPGLFGLDVGNEALDFRVIHDIDRTWRFGIGFKPYVKSNPALNPLSGEQFIEWHPMQVSPDVHTFRPYIAASLVEEGLQSEMDVTVNIQAGFAAHDNFREHHAQGYRLCIGYYNGIDPRMKYFQYLDSTQQWAYGGIVFDM